MVFERPKRPGQAHPSPATQRPPERSQQRPNAHQGGRGGGQGGNNPRRGQDGGHDHPVPSPWLEHPLDPSPNPDVTASFVEYLRWMRSPDSEYKDPTKVQILQMAEEKADYREHLAKLNNRTQLIADAANCFEVTCPWRIRVGGHRGPESILLPAFDALGMPYIPSSTLRGVARTQAIREKLPANLDYSNKEAVKNAWKAADRQVAEWFGHLDAKGSDRTGKVIFLDAYPIPSAQKPGGGLAVDIANSIWSWKDDALEYKPNPNPYFSLEKSTFLVGLRRLPTCSQEQFDQIKQWLISGLNAGVGSQVNSGYGSLLHEGISEAAFFQVEFSLQGQLIHGRQRFENVYEPYERNRKTGQLKRDDKGRLKPRAIGVAEMRPIAFKSMLRYWFRTFSLGVIQPRDVKHWEDKLFGAIDPQTRGWVRVTLSNVKEVTKEARYRNDGCGEYTGTLNLSYSSEAQEEYYDAISNLLKHLTWLMFHLGGVGQGARRPCYSRSSNPFWRGSALKPDRSDSFWQLSESIQEAKAKFQDQIRGFYTSLNALLKIETKTSGFPTFRNAGQVTQHTWVDAVDTTCKILIVNGSDNLKPYALDILHQQFHQLESKGKFRDAKSLCGGAKKDRIRVGPQEIERGAIPSPIWIADFKSYQIVTIFGATENPRKKYLESLQGAIQIFPLT
ncbi:RAMP superfamily CRISPR-associated protein [Thermoleptolyngbya sp.]